MNKSLSAKSGAPQVTTLDAALRNLQIITLALIMGPVVFAVVITIIRELKFDGDLFGNPLTLIAAVMGCSAIVLSFVLPTQILKGALNKAETIDEPWMAQNFLTSGIVRLAVVEGAGMLNLVAWLMAGSIISPIVAALTVLTMLVHFPTQSKVQQFRKICQETMAYRGISTD
jgi:hypothetical protein